MIVGIMGTGTVGRALASAWAGAGHDVVLGSRTADNPVALTWADATPTGRAGTFADAARAAEVVVNATPGTVSLDALGTCGPDDLAGKPLMDVANALDFSDGFPPRVVVAQDRSLAEAIQQAHPAAHVVKAFNTMANEVMVDPAGVPGPHIAPICGDDDGAKATVVALMESLGWRTEAEAAPDQARIIDLGDLTASRGLELWMPLWLTLYGRNGHPHFNLTLATAPDPSRR